MGVSFTKSGIVAASGIEVGENHFQNSNFANGTTSWYGVNGSSINITTKDGINVLTGTKGTSNNITGQTIQDYLYTANTIIEFTISGDVYVEESGTFGVGNWITSSEVSGWQGMSATQTYIISNVLSPGWNKFCVVKTNAKNAYNGKIVTCFSYTGTTYWLANLKFELGSNSTPWIPNVADYGVVPTLHGFAEQDNLMKVYENYITTTEFIEY